MHVLSRPQVTAQGTRSSALTQAGWAPQACSRKGGGEALGVDPGHDRQCPAPRLHAPFDNSGLCTNPSELRAELGGLVPWGLGVGLQDLGF